MNDSIEFKNIATGDAPCGGCGRHIWNIPLLADTIESDGKGGWWWDVAGDQHCIDCGEPLRKYHKPAPIVFDMEVVKEEAER